MVSILTPHLMVPGRFTAFEKNSAEFDVAMVVNITLLIKWTVKTK